MPVSLDIGAGTAVGEVIRPVARWPLQPHPNADEGHQWSLHGGRECGGSGGGMRMVRGVSLSPLFQVNVFLYLNYYSSYIYLCQQLVHIFTPTLVKYMQ